MNSKLKYIIIVGDGMADYPLKELDNQTPLEAAKTPNMDFLVQHGRLGLVRTIPEGMGPGSDVANLSILGYNPKKFYNGRGPLEAASIGVKLGHDEVAWRCNLVTIENGIMSDFTAGHITNPESKKIIDSLNRNFKSGNIEFYHGVSYRHLMVTKGIPDKVNCVPPHDITGKPIEPYLPKGNGGSAIKQLMFESQRFLQKNQINKKRRSLGKKEANMIWLWGQGRHIKFPSLKEKFGLTGAVITAVDLIKGIGKLIGLKPLKVPGVTGFIDTAYENKAKYALAVLKRENFVFVHVESPDEAGHMGDVQLKIQAIEDFDKRVVGTMLAGLKKFERYRLIILPDHYTPIKIKTHSREPVPFVIYGDGIESDNFIKFTPLENVNKYRDLPNNKFRTKSKAHFLTGFTERDAKKSGLVIKDGWKLMEFLVEAVS